MSLRCGAQLFQATAVFPGELLPVVATGDGWRFQTTVGQLLTHTHCHWEVLEPLLIWFIYNEPIKNAYL